MTASRTADGVTRVGSSLDSSLDPDLNLDRAPDLHLDPDLNPDPDPQTRQLTEFGSALAAAATRATIARFSSAFDRGDVDALMATMTTDCVFESTAPPDGQRHEGQAAVRQAWTDFFAASTGAVFETEELIVFGQRAIARWRYTWAPGSNGHVRGIDLFRVRDGLVAEKLSYVKG